MFAIENNKDLPFGIALQISGTAKQMSKAFFYPMLDEEGILNADKAYFDGFFSGATRVISENDKQIEAIAKSYSFGSILVDYALSACPGHYAISLKSPKEAEKFQKEISRYKTDLEKKKDKIGAIISNGRARAISQVLLDSTGLKKYEEISGLCTQPYERAELVLCAAGIYEWPFILENDLEALNRIKISSGEDGV